MLMERLITSVGKFLSMISDPWSETSALVNRRQEDSSDMSREKNSRNLCNLSMIIHKKWSWV